MVSQCMARLAHPMEQLYNKPNLPIVLFRELTLSCRKRHIWSDYPVRNKSFQDSEISPIIEIRMPSSGSAAAM